MRGQQNLEIGRPVHKCLWNSNFASNEDNVVIFGVRTQTIQVLSVLKLFMGFSDSDIDTLRISDPKTMRYQNIKLEISAQVRFAGVVPHSEKQFRLL